ncbi:MAG: TonB-dependent receptor domain-containing protein, partial [Pyrinomonadaceae bacterium]
GAFPTQFSISGGQPLAKVKRTDLGIFFQDDWNIDPKLTVSAGLRYETQTNISSPWNFAPRFAVAYAPGADGQNKPKTVFRGGFGVFYDRFGEDLTLNALRFNGVNQQRFIVTDPAILDAIVFTQDGVSNIPTAEMLAAFAQPQTTRIVQPDLRATYTLQTAASVERQLPFKTTFSATYTHTRVRRLLRSRNINAPFNGVPPIPDGGNIFQYEATGRFDQDLLTINMRTNFIENVSLFGNYSFGSAKSDTDGAGTFPANSYDLTGEFGRAAIDTRHRAVFGGSISIPFGVSLRPFVIYRSGSPFNITTGEDSNEDTIFTERPAFATSLSEPGIVVTRFGAFDPTPEPGDIIIPRNYGRGPKYFAVNLTAAKEFSFGKVKKSADDEADEDDEGKYKLELSIQVRNLFNRNNGGTPVGNLSSSFFGNSVSSAGGRQSGNRRVRLEVLFSF